MMIVLARESYGSSTSAFYSSAPALGEIVQYCDDRNLVDTWKQYPCILDQQFGCSALCDLWLWHLGHGHGLNKPSRAR